MKLKITLYICILTSCFYGYSQSNCTDFRNGTFKFTDKESGKVCIITRKDNEQTEKIENTQEEYHFAIKWVDSCTYTLTPTATTVQKNKEVLKLGTMTVKIIPATDSSYVQLVRVANSPKFKRRDEVFIAKDK
ncbi:hypothetical protein E0W68_05435 [Flavobacterium salilacus subsp. salilacus]|uniref:hypothetical protein n=1 Tax=Flavobacterium TaxID=237 RepID=UPI0010750769|nr:MULTISPECIES: hypothetical protein [Flavobacterium]KAF2519215.1 hypothetical protein E0W68_05435 [Flavobacterium salilacus subsp. salilacus]MBE1613395.1 hypothetical protein [Flavobacterium sp. SaA2.13]